MRKPRKLEYLFTTMTELAQYVRIEPDCGIAYDCDRVMIARKYGKKALEDFDDRGNLHIRIMFKQRVDKAFYMMLKEDVIDTKKLIKDKSEPISKIPDLHQLVEEAHQRYAG